MSHECWDDVDQCHWRPGRCTQHTLSADQSAGCDYLEDLSPYKIRSIYVSVIFIYTHKKGKPQQERFFLPVACSYLYVYSPLHFIYDVHTRFRQKNRLVSLFLSAFLAGYLFSFYIKKGIMYAKAMSNAERRQIRCLTLIKYRNPVSLYEVF